MQKIEFHKSTIKFLSSLEAKHQKRILVAICKLPKGDVLPLSSKKGEYRLRVGSWRILWKYKGETIFIMSIDNRGDAYK